MFRNPNLYNLYVIHQVCLFIWKKTGFLFHWEICQNYDCWAEGVCFVGIWRWMGARAKHSLFSFCKYISDSCLVSYYLEHIQIGPNLLGTFLFCALGPWHFESSSGVRGWCKDGNYWNFLPKMVAFHIFFMSCLWSFCYWFYILPLIL